MQSPAPLSIFDVDRTITRQPTYSAFLLFAAWRRAPWRLLLLPLLIPVALAYFAKLLPRRRMKGAMHALALGTRLPEAEARALGEAFADHLHRRGLYVQAEELMRREAASGRTVMLATAAPDLYIAPLARRLGIAHVIATRCGWDEGVLRPGIDGDNCYGPAKLDAVRAHLAREKMDGSGAQVRFFSDHISDLAVFDWAAEPVAVNASPKLRAVADARGWRAHDWRGTSQPTREPARARRLPA